MKRYVLLTLVFALILQARWINLGGSESSNLDVRVIQSDNTKTIVEVNFPGIWVTDTTAGGNTYQVIKAPGTGIFGRPGNPLFPAYRANIAIPKGVKPTIKILEQNYKEIADVNVFPRQKPKLDKPLPYIVSLIRNQFVKNEKAYNKNSYSPENPAFITGPFTIRDYYFVTLTVIPIQFNPVEKTIKAYNHFVIEISYPEGKGKGFLRKGRGETPELQSTYKHFLLNYDYVKSPPIDNTKQINKFPNGSKYLIITADAYYDAAVRLARWKQQKGLPTRIVKFSDINTAADDSTDIQNFIQSMFDTAAITPLWIELIGDGDSLAPDLAARYHTYGGGGSNYVCPTDHKYECDSFDLGGDTIYADAYVGRLAVGSAAEADTVVQKIVNYERHPNLTETAWYKMGLGIGAYQNGRIFDYTVRRCRIIMLDSLGYTRVDTLMEDGSSDSLQQARIDTMNQGRTFVLFRGHGDLDGWYGGSDNNYPMLLDTNWVGDSLNIPNNKYNVVIAPTCLAGKFNVDTANVMSETFLRDTQNGIIHGSAGYQGATNVSYSFYNDSLAIGIFLSLDPRHLNAYHFQEINNDGKLYMAETYASPDTDAIAYTEFMLMNILGDPEMELWTDIPVEITATHPDTLYINQDNTFTVNVTTVAKKAAVESALVAVVDDSSQVFQTAYTDANGNATFTVHPAYYDTVWFTVTKRNHAPYEGDAIVTDKTSVELSNFTAVSMINGVVLRWRMETEPSNRNWIVERKEQNSDYSIIGKLISKTGNPPYNYTFRDRRVKNGDIYYYRIGKENNGTIKYYGNPIKVFVQGVITKNELYTPYPNPFSTKLNIGFAVIKSTDVNISIYDISGRMVKSYDYRKSPGKYTIIWKPDTKLDNGIYFVKMKTADYSNTQKVILIH